MPNLPSPTIGSKPKAQDDIASPLAQQPRPSKTESPFVTYQQSTSRRQVQPHSLQAIIRDNCGLRLYVPPITWTSDQLRLLTCHFNLRKGRGKQQAHNNRGRVADGTTQKRPERWRHSQLMRAATKLARISTLVAKKFAVEDIMLTIFIFQSNISRVLRH
jgi:hypothetical protein